MSPALIALVCVRPVKKSANGTDPPITPIARRIPTCFLLSVFSSFHFLNATIIPMIKSATSAFFNVVNTIGGFTEVTATFVKKLFVPDINAVMRTSPVASEYF